MVRGSAELVRAGLTLAPAASRDGRLQAPSVDANGTVPDAQPIVRFVGIDKTYDGVTRVVDDLDLDIARGEFLTLLGPSGSGKTTTLMMLAGFEAPTAGEILLEGKPLSRDCRRTSATSAWCSRTTRCFRT